MAGVGPVPCFVGTRRRANAAWTSWFGACCRTIRKTLPLRSARSWQGRKPWPRTRRSLLPFGTGAQSFRCQSTTSDVRSVAQGSSTRSHEGTVTWWRSLASGKQSDGPPATSPAPIASLRPNRIPSSRQSRMLVVLEKADWPVWLGERPGDPTLLLRPPPADVLQCQPTGEREARSQRSLLW